MKHISRFLFGAVAAMLLLSACHRGDPSSDDQMFDFTGTCWTDGYEFYVGGPDTITHNDSLILFQGGNLHEAGMGFALHMIAPDTYLIDTIPGQEWVAMGVVGDTVVLHIIGEEVMLLFYCPDNIEPDTLRTFDPGSKSPREAYAELLHRKRLDAIKGMYVDTKTGTRYQLTDSLYITTDAKGRADTLRYEIFYEMDMPSHTLTLSNGKAVWYEISDKGLDFFSAKFWPNEQAYERGPIFCQTEKL